jgi:hypothetical protein
MRNLFLTISSIIALSCNSEGGKVSNASGNEASSGNSANQEMVAKPKAYFINEEIAAKIYPFTSAAFQNGTYASNTLDNCILEVTLTKHFNDNGYAFYDFYYYIYPKDTNKPNCKNTIGITLYNILRMYTNEQLDNLLNKKLYVYAPSINYNPVKTDNLIDYDCGTYSSIDVFDGWKFVENLNEYEIIEPKIINN